MSSDSETATLRGDAANKPVPGAIFAVHNDDAMNDYSWLDTIDEDNCFMPLSLADSRPSKSLDFGEDGYTGSLSIWHELLQLTAPDPRCGLVFVRGDFPDHPDAIFARAQRRNQKGTFGMSIRIPPPDEHSIHWAQEPTAAQGLINLRWPYTRLDWVKVNSRTGSDPFAAFAVCSFVRQGILYQIARIVPKKVAQTSPAPSVVEVDMETSPHSPHSETAVKFAIDVGGWIRFGCPSTIGNAARRPDAPLFSDDYTVYPPDHKTKAQILTCTSKRHKKRLEMRLWVNRVPQTLRRHECQSSRLDRGPNEVASFHIRQNCVFNDRETKVIVASFKLVDSDTEPVDTDAIHYEQVLHHLGVSDYSDRAPYRLWSTILSSTSSADSFELNAIARSVESTLCVSSMPVATAYSSFPSNDTQHVSSDDTAQSIASDSHPKSRVALLKNIITPQIVDLESAFWQVRLLVKAAKKLEHEIDSLDHSNIAGPLQEVLQEMRPRYRKKIVGTVCGFFLWVLDLFGAVERFDAAPALRDTGVGLLPSDILTNHDSNKRECKSTVPECLIGPQKYYGAMIIWYIMAVLPEVFTGLPLADQKLLWENLVYFGNAQTTLYHSLLMDDPYGCIIRWYHNFALLRLCERLLEDDPVKFGTILPRLLTGMSRYDQPPRASSGAGQPKQKREIEPPPLSVKLFTMLNSRVTSWQTNAEKAMRLYEQGRLRDRQLGHETAILAMVGEEMGIPQQALTVRGVTCLDLAKTLLRRRKPTEKLNAGRSHILRWDPLHDIRSAKPRPAPWELSCLAQHMPYILGVDTCDKDKCLEKCMKFMFSDFSFMGSWDASKTTTVGQWWDYLTTSIVSTKLLEDSTPLPRKQTEDANCQPETRLLAEEVDLLRKIHNIHQTAKEQAKPVFAWKRAKPKKIYHSDSAVRSVEDTPDLGKIQHRPGGNGILTLRLNLKRYFEFNALPGAACPLATIRRNIGASKLHNLSCLDIMLATDNSERPETSVPVVRGRADKAFWDDWVSQDKSRRGALFKLFAEPKRGAGLQDMYLIGRAHKHPFANKKNKKLLLGPDMREDLLKDYQERLFLRLNDSLVDQGVKYRVIFAKRYSPVTMQAMVYMWHPDAIDTFDDHLGELSNFRDTTDQSVTGSENTWISSITIKHWRLLGETETMIRKAEKKVDEDERLARIPPEANKHCCMLLGRNKKKKKPAPPPLPAGLLTGDEDANVTTKAVEERDNDRDFPPLSVRDDRRGSAFLLWWNIHELNKIHELSLSLAITGDAMGRSWTCSIICELFSEEDMIQYANEASRILQMFIHQQDAARCLVFLMFLGYMCLALAKECDLFMYELDGVMRLDSQVLLNGMEWEKSDRALKKLKQMLWGFESLRSFRDMLQKAIEQVDKARARMTKLLENGAPIRHEDMKSAELRIQEEFEKKYNRLEAAHQAVDQRVEQGYKLREGITSVLGVEQNENISMLTWLTIIYLGPAFVVGLFGMSTNSILPDTSSTTFYRLLGGLLGGTILFALCLSTFIAIIRWIWRQLTNPIKHAWGIGHQKVRNRATYLWKHRYELFPWLPGGEGEKRTKRVERDVERDPTASQEAVGGNGAVMVGAVH